MNKRTGIATMVIFSMMIIALVLLAKSREAINDNQNYEGPRYVTVFSTEVEVYIPPLEETTTENMDVVEGSTVTTKTYYDVDLSHQLQDYIRKMCKGHNISPALVMAIIERESACDEYAVGDNGNSIGLMQIQPKWHQWRADKLGCLDWYNPYDNVTVGIDILAELFERYGDDIYTVLMAYNGGASYANEMNAKGAISEYALEVNARAEELEQCDIAREE